MAQEKKKLSGAEKNFLSQIQKTHQHFSTLHRNSPEEQKEKILVEWKDALKVIGNEENRYYGW